MKILLLLSSLLLTLATPALRDRKDTPPASRPRRPLPSTEVAALPKLGRCSGDASCTACSSCEYCGHCAGGGGTCGVCAPVAAVRRVYRVVRPHYRATGTRGGTHAPSSSRTPPVVASLAAGLSYYVAAETLNLRAEPTADAEVVRVLTRNDIVTVLALPDAKWAQVRVTTDVGDIEGYVVGAYLSETEGK